MANWYTYLIDKLQLTATGVVADNFKIALESGAFRKFEESKGIDVSVSNEVGTWFTTIFQGWFTKLIGLLQAVSNYADPSYIALINSIIQSLEVARAYYSKQADIALTTSLKNVALSKVMLIEEMITSLSFAYEQTLKSVNIDPVKSIQMTDAVNFEGSTPESFKWNKNKVIVNHVIFKEMQENTAQTQQCEVRKKDYLPWVIASAFGLIAWSSAVTKQKNI
jgi:hypothetical protein